MEIYIRVVDECAERVRSILQTRYDELEDLRDAINDKMSTFFIQHQMVFMVLGKVHRKFCSVLCR